jgi:NlpC/P60 family putative phage cell wall peptidase
MTTENPSRPVDGTEIVRVARTWIGTPYHHQASIRGVGTDCLGLVRGVWREVFGTEAELPPAYSRDWAEASGRETMIEAARRHMTEIDPAAARAGDVLIFRLRPGMVAKHAGIAAGTAMMIHAMEFRVVSEVPVGPWWRRRLAAVFRFPGVV